MHRLVIVSLSGGCRTSPCSGIGWRGDLHCVCCGASTGRMWEQAGFGRQWMRFAWRKCSQSHALWVCCWELTGAVAPAGACTGHGMLSLHPRGSTGESRQLRDSQALGREGRARREVGVHAGKWMCTHQFPGIFTMQTGPTVKGLSGFPTGAGQGMRFPLSLLCLRAALGAARGLLLIFRLSGVLCFPRRHQNAQGFCLLASSSNLVLMVLHSWKGFKIRQPLAQL